MPATTDLADQTVTGLLEHAAKVDGLVRDVAIEQLRVAYEWAIAHPVIDSAEGPAGPVLPEVLAAPELLGGAGTPAVAAFTAEPLAVACGISPPRAAARLADALDLHHRLPLLWDHVRAGRVEVWKARRVAVRTRDLSFEGARWVDRQIAGRVGSLGAAQLDRTIAEAAARIDGDALAGAEADGRAGWDVRLVARDPRHGGASAEIHAVGDTLDLTRFHDLVCAEAEALGRLGDGDRFEARKAKALGVIADAQARLDLTTLLTPAAANGVTLQEQNQIRRNAIARRDAKVRLYLHASLADYAAGPTGEEADRAAVGTVEGLGPVTIAQVKEWVAGARVTVVPVLHAPSEDTWSVDRHDPPPRMAEAVVLTDTTCVFPWCTHPARQSDLDHINAYVDPDAGGPPGQTTPLNLAPLCRRHHRAKTSGTWSYQRLEPGTYLWSGPGVTVLVTPQGTAVIPPG